MEPCRFKQCYEMKYRAPLYLLKSDLLRHLRELHRSWWDRYESLYEKGNWCISSVRSPSGWDYSGPAKEMLTRCRIYDSLFSKVVGIDLTTVRNFGGYCRQVFVEINKLRPAFPGSAVSVGVFDLEVRELRKFVMKQSGEQEALEANRGVEGEGEIREAG